jgi:hypothetical protein
MTDSDETIFLNNDHANRVYRIVDQACAENGCTAEQCNKIANQAAKAIGMAEARSKKGQLSEVTWNWFKEYWVKILSSIGAAILAGIVWVLDLIKIGGGS